MPTVISVFNSSQFGSPDPSGLAYNPVAGGLFLVDSEVDETPFFSDTNMFSVNFDGSLQQSYAFTSVSTEPTGVAFDPATGRLYVSDDRSEEHTSELQSLMSISYAVFCLKKKHIKQLITETRNHIVPNTIKYQ